MKYTTTLNEIRSHKPCESGWKKLLAAYPGRGMDEIFDVLDVFRSNGLDDMEWLAKTLPSMAPAWAEYERVNAPAWAEYQRVKAPAWEAILSGGESEMERARR